MSPHARSLTPNSFDTELFLTPNSLTPNSVLHRLAVRFGLPALPEWADWFGADLDRRGLVEELLGFNCSPVAIKGTKLRMLRILSTGIKRKLIAVPLEVSVPV